MEHYVIIYMYPFVELTFVTLLITLIYVLAFGLSQWGTTVYCNLACSTSIIQRLTCFTFFQCRACSLQLIHYIAVLSHTDAFSLFLVLASAVGREGKAHLYRNDF